MNVDQHIWRNPYPLIAVLSTPQRCLELSGCPAENEHIKHTVRADLKRQLRGTSHYKQCHLSLFSLHMAKQLCFSPLLGILLHSSILHKWEQRALWFCCLAALLVNRGHWDTWGNLITAFTRRLVNCKDGCFCCWITLQRWKYGREKKQQQNCSLSPHGKYGRWFHSCVHEEIGFSPFLILQALISHSSIL